MVAVRAANPAADAIASELGSLLHAHVVIGDRRWRLDAAVRIVPALRRYDISLDRVRAVLRDGLAVAPCVRPVRECLDHIVEIALARGSADTLAALVEVAWTRSWEAGLLGATRVAIALSEWTLAREIVALQHRATAIGRYLQPRLEALLRRGFIAEHGNPCPRFAGDVEEPGSENAFEPSLPLLIAMVDASCARGDGVRASDAERVFGELPARDRPIASAHLARLALHAGSVGSALARLRSIRAPGIRAGAQLVLARSAIRAGRLDVARELVDATERVHYRDRGYLDLARAHAARRETSAALRTLGHVRAPGLEAERELLRDEIVLALVRDVESPPRIPDEALRAAWAPPGWTEWTEWREWRELDDTVDARAREAIVRAANRARYGMRERDPIVLDGAADAIGQGCTQRAGRRALCELFDAAGIATRDLVFATALPAWLRDAVLAEHVAVRAERLAAGNGVLPPPFVDGFGGGTSDAPARSIERALFDEGLALSRTAAPRRRVLITTARHCLREALAHPADWASEAVATRLRTLVHLGGALGRDAIAKALATLPLPCETATRALEALATLDATAARDIVLGRTLELEAAGVDTARALRLVEAYRGLPVGFARAFARARTSIARVRGDAAALPWLAELVACWRTTTGTIPTVEVLRLVGTRRELPDSPVAFRYELDGVTDILRAGDHVTCATRVASDGKLLDAVLLAQPPRVDPTMRAWAPSQWRKLLDKATVKASATPVAAAVIQFARQLGHARQAAALLAGDLTALGVPATTSFAARGETFRLRLLDKRVDLPTYLRFADVSARCCFRSDDRYYQRTEAEVITVWKDPLSFCFHVERGRGDAFRPFGFVFGGFARVSSGLAILVNGLYMRPNTPDVRALVVDVLERAFAPLGISMIGIASSHGGRGALPDRYHQRSVDLTRIRALALAGQPSEVAYDDISSTVNRRIRLVHLWWRAT